MNAASRVSNNAATSSTFMHASGIVMASGRIKKTIGKLFCMGICNADMIHA